MPAKIHTYVDNSNFFIEGQRLAAVKMGYAQDLQDAFDRAVFDFSWQPDYGKLHQFLCGADKSVTSAKLWGSPPPGDTFWDMVKRKGFLVKTYERSHGKEKKVDVAIAYQIAKDSPKIDKANDEIVLVAGDKDFVPVVEDLVAEGYSVTVVFWGHAAKEMKEKASTFVNLDKWHGHFTK